MSEQVQMPVRQAGAIYLKNMVSQYWMDRKTDKPNELVPFCLHDSDKQTIRDNLIEAVIHSPDPIRSDGIFCLCFIINEVEFFLYRINLTCLKSSIDCVC